MEEENESLKGKGNLSSRGKFQKEESKSYWWIYLTVIVGLVGSGWFVFRWVR